jgi:hypothetical protein
MIAGLVLHDHTCGKERVEQQWDDNQVTVLSYQ